MINTVAGRPQVFDDTWMRRLGIARHDFSIGMTDDQREFIARFLKSWIAYRADAAE